MFRIVCYAVLGGVVGAKLGEFAAEGWPLRISFWSIFDPEFGGKALLGGILGGWIAAGIAKRRMGITRSTGDLFALALPAGEAVGRIGCYFNGCCYGIATKFPIAIYQHGAWRHPTQIYSSITAALIFTALFLVRDKLPREGDLFKLYLLLFGITRFGIEFIRERPPFFMAFPPCSCSVSSFAFTAVLASCGLLGNNSLDSQEAQYRKCEHCGSPMGPNQPYCASCGASLKKAGSPLLTIQEFVRS